MTRNENRVTVKRASVDKRGTGDVLSSFDNIYASILEAASKNLESRNRSL